ncbi:hypothetical protein G6F50_018191 [Rhizopus delemar]|uniref:Uncharacterized protein n=1 Tax=Rhizopus delemar TaxID=936053 RepID=A0A9P6XNI0_9FUNG|nr:hypothetical protein G6F50_018191 [Rhizopus delemar]
MVQEFGLVAMPRRACGGDGSNSQDKRQRVDRARSAAAGRPHDQIGQQRRRNLAGAPRSVSFTAPNPPE